MGLLPNVSELKEAGSAGLDVLMLGFQIGICLSKMHDWEVRKRRPRRLRSRRGSSVIEMMQIASIEFGVVLFDVGNNKLLRFVSMLVVVVEGLPHAIDEAVRAKIVDGAAP